MQRFETWWWWWWPPKRLQPVFIMGAAVVSWISWSWRDSARILDQLATDTVASPPSPSNNTLLALKLPSTVAELSTEEFNCC